jgi:hypothetical protein
MSVASTSPSFICPHCGIAHDDWPTDYGYSLPDDVWAVPPNERSARAKWTDDLCQMDDRHLIRCLLKVPFTDRPDYSGWGLWVEVSSSTFHRYRELYDKDATAGPPHSGNIANEPRGYRGICGSSVTVHLRSSSQRLFIAFPAGASCRLANEQNVGIDSARYHEILISVGAIEP